MKTKNKICECGHRKNKHFHSEEHNQVYCVQYQRTKDKECLCKKFTLKSQDASTRKNEVMKNSVKKDSLIMKHPDNTPLVISNLMPTTLQTKPCKEIVGHNIDNKDKTAGTSLIICKRCEKETKRFVKGFCKSCYNREWLKNLKFRKKQAEYVRNYSHQNKDKIRDKARRRYKNPEERKKFLIRAKTVYSNEKTGICNDCKSKGKTEFHHLSYDPNIFIEVCKKCHNKRHGRELYV